MKINENANLYHRRGVAGAFAARAAHRAPRQRVFLASSSSRRIRVLFVVLLVLTVRRTNAGDFDYEYRASITNENYLVTNRLNLKFELYPSEAGTNMLGQFSAVTPISNGQFSVTGSFGKPLKEAVRHWIQISTPSQTNSGVFFPLGSRRSVVAGSNHVLAEVSIHDRWYRFASTLFGLISVVFFGLARFNTPPSNRASTTAVRYWSAAIFYSFVGIVVYLVLINSPEALNLVQRDTHGLPEFVSGLSTPLFVALLMTVFLPKVPGLSRWDERVRFWFQRRAEIPRAAERLSVRLERALFECPAAIRAVVFEKLTNEGFGPSDIEFKDRPLPQSAFTKVEALLELIRQNKTDDFQEFDATFPDEIQKLERNQQLISKRARVCFRLFGKAGSENDEAVQQLQRDFVAEAKLALEALFNYISRAVLRCEFTNQAAHSKLRKLGFNIPAFGHALGLDHFILLFFLTFVTVTLFLVFGDLAGQSDPVYWRFGRVGMIAAMYCIAVASTVYPRSVLDLPKVDQRGVGPWKFYALASILAALGSALVQLIFYFILKNGDWRAIGNRFSLQWPYLLVPTATALFTAWSCDNAAYIERSLNWASNKFAALRGLSLRTRYVEGLIQGAAGILVGVAVWRLLDLTHSELHGVEAQVPALRHLLPVFGTLGCIIGLLVPTWVRSGGQRFPSVDELEAIKEVCMKYGVRELNVIGREGTESSDLDRNSLDVLVEFSEGIDFDLQDFGKQLEQSVGWNGVRVYSAHKPGDDLLYSPFRPLKTVYDSEIKDPGPHSAP